MATVAATAAVAVIAARCTESNNGDGAIGRACHSK
eukprot:CAMPEP_0181229076 /NCGR_PEP_ID=MMETSP1096-20121128/33696_1 /TAXON_ID=156174 ORGANISM="Chrysochromulina ericina, Strain CCMP281" /NCGR_SAMPLE_ID=MMETSP1096 /ASSEMBLY_ACC=CAM_ASM_000453 /LENGTH=34 /DNA_ID= /DNA_START= /DNA_END= /DNA_ORIENTATION=